jgi:hypothetical protein
MDTITYFVALPFQQTEEGELVAGEAKECQSAQSAIRAAERLSRLNAGAVAFSRSGDPSLGDFSDATIIKRFGEVPSDMLP